MRLFSLNIIILLFLLVFGRCSSLTDSNTNDLIEVLEFPKELHDFGELPLDTAALYSFKFKNISQFPVEIKNVESSCGCTIVSKWQNKIVNPRKLDSIDVVFKPQIKVTKAKKSIYITYAINGEEYKKKVVVVASVN